MKTTSARPGHVVLKGGSPSLFWVAAIAAIAAAVSLLISGFQFGVHNNAYHVPYVLRWTDLPQFADDAFYQSLRYFTSAVWLLLRAVATEDNVVVLFFTMHVLTRLATFYALALLVRQTGLTDRVQLGLALTLLAVTAWLHRSSVVADHGLFLGDFTHSEVAWPFVLFSIYFARQASWRLSAMHAALAFLCNVFVGLWLALILVVLVARDWKAVALKELAIASAIYIALVTPLLLWVGTAIGSSGALVDFSFRDYLSMFYPRHFLLDAAQLGRIGLLLAVAIAGWSSSYLVPRHGSSWRAALLTSGAIFLAGALSPFFLDSRLVFNLHLMRVDGFIQMFSILLVVCGGLRVLFDAAGPAWQRGAMVIVLGLLCMPWRFGMPAIAVLCALVAMTAPSGSAASAGWKRRVDAWFGAQSARGEFAPLAIAMGAAAVLMGVNYLVQPLPSSVIGIGIGLAAMALLWGARRRLVNVPRPNLPVVSLLVVGLIVGSHVSKANEPFLRAVQAVDPATEAAWLDLAAWIRKNPLDGVVLVPVEDFLDRADDYMLDHNFQLVARTSVWVDWKQGAAVMWYPQFFHRWAPRYQAAQQVRTAQEFRDLARAEGIPYFVPRAYDTPACPDGSTTVHASGPFKLCRITAPG